MSEESATPSFGEVISRDPLLGKTRARLESSRSTKGSSASEREQSACLSPEWWG